MLTDAIPDDVNAEISALSQIGVDTHIYNNSLVSATKSRNISINVRVEEEGRVGYHCSDHFNVVGLQTALERARANAKSGRSGPLILTPSTGYREMNLDYPDTAEQSSATQARLLKPLLDIAASKINIQTRGMLTAQSGEFTIVNSAGLAATTATTFAQFQVFAVGVEGLGQGYGYACNRSAQAMDLMTPFMAAAAKSLAASFPKSISGGKYTVILEPAAVADLMNLLAKTVFNARAYLRGQSPVSNIGQRIFGENINIWDDGLDARGFAIPFDFQGVPKQRLNLISRGVVANIALDNDTAAIMAKSGTGHSPAPGQVEPRPTHIFMEAGNAMLDDMIASTRRGILISRLRNLAILDPRSCLMTGVTGNGTLWIEGGKLISALPNLRFVQNLVEIFNEVEMIGDETQAFGGLWGGLTVPALKVQGFNILGSIIGQS